MSDLLASDPAGGIAIPELLRPMRSLVVAIFDRDGRLLDANRGFHELGGPDPSGQAEPAAVFLNPALPELLRWAEQAGDQRTVYEGPVTLGDPEGAGESWLGRIYRQQGYLLVACELDIDQERDLRGQLLSLNQESADKERELARVNRELAVYADELERLSLSDSLTGLANRRYFEDMLAHHLETVERFGEPLAMLILDIDHFKDINDSHGHAVGDEVLKGVAEALSAKARKADVVVRWGGEEFAVLALRTDADGALELAERLREGVAAMECPAGVSAVTVSAGIAGHLAGDTPEDLFRRADEALYRAKQGGRNRSEVAVPD